MRRKPCDSTAHLLPDEPGGYTGFQALFGHRYVAPQLGAGTPERDQGRLPGDEHGRQPGRPERQPDQRRVPGQPPRLPRVRPHQRLADAGLHVRHAGVRPPGGERLHLRHPRQRAHPGAVRLHQRPGRARQRRACYIAQAQYYNQAFGTFFKRLAAAGITPQNTEFLLSPDEGDHEAGANVGRAIQPTPANCDGATVSGTTVTPDVPCTYPAGSFGELAGNITGLLATEKNNTTPFTLENDTAPEFYVTGSRPDRAPGPQAGAGRRRADGGQPVHRHHPGHHQLPGRPDRRGHPAHRQRGPGPDTDVRAVRQARLLPVQRLGDVQRLLRHPEHRVRLGPR